MFRASFRKYQLQFGFSALTSRGAMKFKNGYYIFITDGAYTGVGECSFIEGLSMDNLENYESVLQELCSYIENRISELPALSLHPSIQCGWEMARLDLFAKGTKILFPSAFTKGEKQILINGLVWMGTSEFMTKQITQKLNEGFKCIKIKVGAVDFEKEIKLIDFIRQKYPSHLMEIRLDANGAFKEHDVLKKLETLSKFNIHSIEQPVKQGQWELMKKVCAESPIPVALDEELIGLQGQEKKELLDCISPHYIILKPSLLGGFAACEEWIRLAHERNIKWWATSALESNIGLNTIAQWVFTQNEKMVQGLGTGGLYTNNISSPLFIRDGCLGYNPTLPWGKVPIPE